MNKVIALIGLLWLWTFVSFSQSNYPEWPQPDAQWTYCCADPAFASANAHAKTVTYDRDTTINNKTYQVISDISYITRFSNDTIYRYFNNQDHLLFYYDLMVGDSFPTVRAPAYIFEDTCNNITYHKVYQMDLIEINGQNHVQWHIKVSDDNNPMWQEHTYKFIENIGFDSFPWSLHPLEMECGAYASDADYCNLGTYEDQQMNYEFYSCPMANLNDQNKDPFKIYPNPASESLTIEFSDFKAHEITITNFLGQEIYHQTKNEGKITTIDVTQFSQGVYIVCLEQNGKKIFQKKWVKQ